MNVRDEIIFDLQNQVLIVSWWNVNQEFVDSLLRLSGFIRYMVECECGSIAVDLFQWIVLIDTWWNVNSVYLNYSFVCITGFNRYMVECE